MEPEWTKGITNNTICNTYYLVFVFSAVVGVLAVISAFVIPFLSGMSPTMKIMQGLGLVLQGLLAAFLSLIAYLLCDRALKPTSRIF